MKSYYLQFAKEQINEDSEHKKAKIGIGVMFLCLFLLIILSASYIYTKQYQFYEFYGEWEWCNIKVNEQTLATWQGTNAVSVGKQYDVGDIVYTNSDTTDVIGKLSYLNQEALQQFHFNLTEGHMPVNDDEIAMDTETLSLLGLHIELNQKVLLPVVINGVQTTKEYTLVGLLQPYRYRWNIADKSLLPVVLQGGVEPDVLPQKLWLSNHSSSINVNNNATWLHNDYAYGNLQWLSRQDGLLVVGVVCFGLVCYLMLYYFIRGSLMVHIKDLEVLKKLGATSKELIAIKNWVLWYLTRCYVPVACGIGLGIPYFISKLPISFHITYPFTTLLIGFLLCVMSMLCAIHLPTYQRKKRKIHFPVLHQKTNAITLACRMLMTTLSNSFLAIGMTTILIIVGLYGFYSEQLVQNEYQMYQQRREQLGDYTIISKGDSFLSEANVEGLRYLPYVQEFIPISVYKTTIQFPDQEQSEAVQNWKQRGSLEGTLVAFENTEASKKYFYRLTAKKLEENSVVYLNNPFFYVQTGKDESYCHTYSSLENAESQKKLTGEAYVVENLIKEATPLTILQGTNTYVLPITDIRKSIDSILGTPLDTSPYTFFINEKVLPSSIQKSQVNYVMMKANDTSNALIDQEIAKIFAKNDQVEIINNRLQLDDVHDKLVETSTRTYVLCASTLIIWLLLMYKQGIAFSQHQRKTFVIVSKVGASNRFFIGTILIEGNILMLISLVLGVSMAHYLVPTLTADVSKSAFPSLWVSVGEHQYLVMTYCFLIWLLFSGLLCWSQRKELLQHGKD